MNRVTPIAALGALLLSSGAQAQEVGILCAGGDPAASIADSIRCTGHFVRIDVIDTSLTTPSLVTLQNFHSVMVCNQGDLPHADAVALGDALADYADNGGGVVVGAGGLSGSTRLGGRFVDDGYLPASQTDLVKTCPGGLRFDPMPGMFQQPGAVPLGLEGHPVFYGGNVLDMGESCHAPSVTTAPGFEHISDFTNGALAIAASDTAAANKVVALNFNIYSDASSPDGWPAAAPVNQILANSLLWTGGFRKPAGTSYEEELTQDLNCNGVDASRESLIDLSDPTCASFPSAADPFLNNDYYYDFLSFGCEFPVVEDREHSDPENGGLEFHEVDWSPYSEHPVQLGDLFVGLDPLAGIGMIQTDGTTGMLVCDNCLYQYNPDQADIDSDNLGDVCDNCPYVPNTDQLNGCPPIVPDDGDCFGNACDNCPCTFNPDQRDTDADLLGDACDNCPTVFNPDQSDLDQDFWGDLCDNCPYIENPGQGDADFDGVGDSCDNCPFTVNPTQADIDEDGLGDACDNCPTVPDDIPTGQTSQPDADDDGVGDICDNCEDIPNFDQIDSDLDDVGDVCDNCMLNANGDQQDRDEDGLGDACDNCQADPNPDQEDVDLDEVGDVCDNCPEAVNTDQRDSDLDDDGDVCDLCPDVPTAVNVDSDGDTIGDACDNCPHTPNIDQEDADEDGKGDLCDTFEIRGGGGPADRNQCGCSSAHIGGGPIPLLLLGVLALARRSSNGSEVAR